MRSHVVRIPQPAPWISANGREHYHAKAQLTKVWRRAAAINARAAKVANLATPVTIDAVVHKARNGRWDAHNLMPTVKAAIDGLVDAGVIPDDSNAHLTRVSIEAGPKSASPNLTLTITETEPQP